METGTWETKIGLAQRLKGGVIMDVVNAEQADIRAAGGVAPRADAALMMQLGADGVFVGSGIFKSSNTEVRAKAIVEATIHYQDPKIIAEVSKNLGAAMPGLDIKQIPVEQLLASR